MRETVARHSFTRYSLIMPCGHPLTPETVSEIDKRTAEGASASSIARSLGLSVSAVAKVAREWRALLGLPQFERTMPDEVIADIETRTLMGETAADIARAVGYSMGAVATRVRRYRHSAGLPPLFDRAVVDRHMIAQIEHGVLCGQTEAEMAEEVGLSPSTVHKYAASYRQRIGMPASKTLPMPAPAAPLDEAEMAEIERLVLEGRSRRTIERHLRRGKEKLNPVIREVRAHHGMAAQPNRPSALTEEQERQIVKLSAAGVGPTAIAATLGIARRAAEMRSRQIRARLGDQAPRPRKRTDVPAQTVQLIEMRIEAGETATSIARDLNMVRGTVISIARRWRDRNGEAGKFAYKNNRIKGARKPGGGRAKPPPPRRPNKIDPTLLRHVAQLVPRTLDPSLRDEVIGDICLAVLAGSIDREMVGKEVKRFVSAGFAAWADKFKSRSLDAPIGEEDTRTLGDMIEDDTAYSSMEDVTIGR